MTTTDSSRPLKKLEITVSALAGLLGPGHHAFDIIAGAVPEGARLIGAKTSEGVLTMLFEHETFDLADVDVESGVPSMRPVLQTCSCGERAQ